MKKVLLKLFMLLMLTTFLTIGCNATKNNVSATSTPLPSCPEDTDAPKAPITLEYYYGNNLVGGEIEPFGYNSACIGQSAWWGTFTRYEWANTTINIEIEDHTSSKRYLIANVMNGDQIIIQESYDYEAGSAKRGFTYSMCRINEPICTYDKKNLSQLPTIEK